MLIHNTDQQSNAPQCNAADFIYIDWYEKSYRYKIFSPFRPAISECI